MHVPETGPYRHMQCSNRKFIVAGISAVVMLSSANGVLAQEASPQSSSMPSPSPQEAFDHDGAIVAPSDSSARSTDAYPVTSQWEQRDVQGFAADIMNRYGIDATGGAVPETIPPVPEAIAGPVFTPSVESFPPTLPAAPTLPDPIDYSLDPVLEEALQELLDSAEVMAQESQNTPSAESDAIDLSVSSPENVTPIPEFTSDVEDALSDAMVSLPAPPELIAQVDEPMVEEAVETEDDPLPESELDESDRELEVDDVDDVGIDDDSDDEADDVRLLEGFSLDEFEDGETSTDAAALLAPPPDYLNPDPNPLFFPTEPSEVEVRGTQPLTLDQVLILARQNSRELQLSLLALEDARAALREERAARFPTLSLGSDITHTDFNPAVEATDAFGNPVDVDNNTTTLNGDVTISYDLFTSGFRNSQIRIAQANLREAELQVEVISEDIRLAVTTAYYDLQQSDEDIRIARADLEESLVSLRDAAARERAGVGTRFDRLQAEVDVANSRQELRISVSDRQTFRRNLAQLLSLPSGVDVSAADEVAVAGVWPLTLEESLVEAFKNRAELEQELLQREVAQQSRRAARSVTLPQLSLVGQYSLNDLLDETGSTSDSESFSISAQLAWTLFDGGATRAAVRRAEIQEQTEEVEFADQLEEIRFDVEEAFFDLGANLENIQTAQTAVEVARESLRLARLRFQAGVGIQSDVITAQSDLADAETNLVTAILDYNRALVSIQRAVSNLDGNLTDVP